MYRRERGTIERDLSDERMELHEFKGLSFQLMVMELLIRWLLLGFHTIRLCPGLEL